MTASQRGDKHDHAPPSPGHGWHELAHQWDQRYSASPQVFRAEPDHTLVELVGALPAGRAVDLGAGEGRNSLWLASRGWNTTAVDASGVALQRLEANALAQGLHVSTLVADLVPYLEAAVSRGEHFGLVVMAYVHPGPEQRPGLLSAAASAVAPGGHLFVVGHHLSSLGKAGPPDPDRLYVEDDVRDALTGLELLRLDRRGGVSDVEDHGTDLVVWAQRPVGRLTGPPGR